MRGTCLADPLRGVMSAKRLICFRQKPRWPKRRARRLPNPYLTHYPMRNLRHMAKLVSLSFGASLLLIASNAFAADPPGYFPLIVRGGPSLTRTFADNVLTLQFQKSRVAAGDPRTYMRMPVASAAWVDRPLNKAEPFVLKQRANQELARTIIAALSNKVRFWKFLCRNTNAGYFEVLRSEAAFASVPID